MAHAVTSNTWSSHIWTCAFTKPSDCTLRQCGVYSCGHAKVTVVLLTFSTVKYTVKMIIKFNRLDIKLKIILPGYLLSVLTPQMKEPLNKLHIQFFQTENKHHHLRCMLCVTLNGIPHGTVSSILSFGKISLLQA